MISSFFSSARSSFGVEEGAEVKAGQKLLGFDREAIKNAGYNDTVVMLLTNSDDLEGVECGIK